MNIFKILETQAEKGNTFVTYDGEIISRVKAEAEAKKSYLADIDNNKSVTLEQYTTEWIAYNTANAVEVVSAIGQIFAEGEEPEE